MSFSVSLFAATPAELKKAREDNEHFGVIFKSREVLKLKNLGDLQRLLDSKLQDLP